MMLDGGCCTGEGIVKEEWGESSWIQDRKTEGRTVYVRTGKDNG